MAIAHDIVAIRSAREILLIGPRLSLAAAPKREFLGESAARFKLRAAMSDPGDNAQLRRGLELWGLDTSRLTHTSDWALCDFVADLVGAGRLRALIAPDVDTQIAPTQRPPQASAELAALLTKSSLFASLAKMNQPKLLTAEMLTGLVTSDLGEKLARVMPKAPTLTPEMLAKLAKSDLVRNLPAMGGGRPARPVISPEALAKLASSEFVQNLGTMMGGMSDGKAAETRSPLTSDLLRNALNSPLGKKLLQKALADQPYHSPEGVAELAASPQFHQLLKQASALVVAQSKKLDVSGMDLEERLMLVLSRTVESDRLSDAAGEELKAFLDPQTIAMTVAVLALWAASHLTPFGYIADALMLGVGVFFAGRAAIEGGKKIAKFLGLTMSAKTEADLDLAADMLAAAIALLSVKLFAKLMTKGAGGLNGAVAGKRVPPPRPQIPVLPKGNMNRNLGPAPPRGAAAAPPPAPLPSKPPVAKPKKAKKSRRLEYMGKTPGKGSKTGKAVIVRMRQEQKGKPLSQRTIRGAPGKEEFRSPRDGKWYSIKDADMSHKRDAVKYWNKSGYKHGPKSEQVRKFMRDADNYHLEHRKYNRSDGAKLREQYRPPKK